MLQVLLAAGDTFRAAAAEQLQTWAERAGAEFFGPQRDNQRPDALLYQARPAQFLPITVACSGGCVAQCCGKLGVTTCHACWTSAAMLLGEDATTVCVPKAHMHAQAVEAAVKQDLDLVVCDTSGRLHTNARLMEELAKCRRSLGKRLPGAPHQSLLVLDGTTGGPDHNSGKLAGSIAQGRSALLGSVVCGSCSRIHSVVEPAASAGAANSTPWRRRPEHAEPGAGVQPARAAGRPGADQAGRHRAGWRRHQVPRCRSELQWRPAMLWLVVWTAPAVRCTPAAYKRVVDCHLMSRDGTTMFLGARP